MKKLLPILCLCALLVSCSSGDTVTRSGNSDIIRHVSVSDGDLLTFPYLLSGEARGNWFFEANFPVVLTDESGAVISSTYATAQGDWMTADYVPFTAKLDAHPAVDSGFLLLKYSNASGEPSRDDSVKIPVRFH